MVEKMDFKRYKNYPQEVTEVVDSTCVETVKIAHDITEPLEITINSETGTEVVYKPDPDIDIEEFKVFVIGLSCRARFAPPLPPPPIQLSWIFAKARKQSL